MAQPKSGTLTGMTVEQYARQILKELIKKSVDGGVEYGGVIHRHIRTNELGTTGPFKGDSPTHVDVRVWAPAGDGTSMPASTVATARTTRARFIASP